MDAIIRFMFTSSDDGDTLFFQRGRDKVKVKLNPTGDGLAKANGCEQT